MTRHWSPTTHLAVCEFNSILVSTIARLFRALNCIVHTLTHDKVHWSMQLMLRSPFDDHWHQPGSLYFPHEWKNYCWISTFSPQSWSLVLLDINLIGSKINPKLNLKNDNPASVVGCFVVGLIPCCSCSFLTCICCFLHRPDFFGLLLTLYLPHER